MECSKCRSQIVLEGVRFCPFCGQSLQWHPEERRNAIIGFADLSGFTSLSRRSDPDQLREWIDNIMRRFVSAIEQRGGSVDKIIGDAIMFLFNVESSHENDPVRAMETIETLHAELTAFNAEQKLDLELHCGMAYGTVSVGTVGNARTVMGDAVNLAARLLAVAGTRETVVSPAFAELLGPGYRFELLPPKNLKGFEEPITPYRYVGRVSFQEDEIPFIGRGKELRLLGERVANLSERRTGGSLLLVAPSGMGKTRLLAELRKHLAEKSMVSVTLYFEEGGVPFHVPFQALIDRLLPQQQLPEVSWGEMGVAQMKEYLRRSLNEAASRSPILLFCEDLHRAERSAQTLLLNLIEEMSSSPILFLLTSRRPIEGVSETLEIHGLEPSDAIDLIHRSFETSVPDPKGLSEAVEKCGGSPLFLRELAKGVRAGRPLDQLAGGKMEFLLAPMLDTLPREEQELVKQAALFGTRAPLRQLAALAGTTQENCAAKLAPVGLFHFLADQKVVTFRNDLLRNYAYERINLRTRQKWHRTLAENLVTEGAYPEDVAYHFLRSAQKEPAMQWSLRAGTRLAHLARNAEALGFLGETQRLAKELNAPKDLMNAKAAQFEIEFQPLKVEEALDRVHQFETELPSAKEPWMERRLHRIRGTLYYERRLYDKALEEALAASSGEDEETKIEVTLLRARALAGLGRYKDTVRLVMQMMRTATLTATQRGVFWHLLGFVSHHDRETTSAREFYEKSLEACREGNDVRGIRFALQNLGNLLFSAEAYDEAREKYSEAAQLGLKLGSFSLYCESLQQIGRTRFALLQFEQAIEHYRRTLATLGEGYNEGLRHELFMTLGASLRYLGDLTEAHDLLERARGFFSKTGNAQLEGQTLRLLAELHRDREDDREAARLVKLALPLLDPYPVPRQLAHLLEAQLLCRRGDYEEAHERLQHIYKGTRWETGSHLVRARHLQISSMANRRKNAETLTAIETFLNDTKKLPMATYRLPLLVEALEYGTHEKHLQEALDVAKTIRQAFPERYRQNFEKKGYVVRLRELTRSNPES